MLRPEHYSNCTLFTFTFVADCCDTYTPTALVVGHFVIYFYWPSYSAGFVRLRTGSAAVVRLAA